MKSDKIMLELDTATVERLVESMPTEAKIRLVQKLERETWASRLDNIVSKIRKKFAKARLTDKEITQICEFARQKFYNERTESSN